MFLSEFPVAVILLFTHMDIVDLVDRFMAVAWRQTVYDTWYALD
jgi:hypothetical protein